MPGTGFCEAGAKYLNFTNEEVEAPSMQEVSPVQTPDSVGQMLSLVRRR